MERVMPTKCHDVWHPLFFRLKMWTMGFAWTLGFAVDPVLFQMVTDLTFHFVDLLYLHRRQEFFVFSIVFLANVDDLLACSASSSLAGSSLCFGPNAHTSCW